MATKKKATTRKKAAPKKKTSTKGASKLVKITAKAKKMYRSGEAKSWPAAMKKAAKAV